MLDRSATANQLVELLGSWHHGGPTYRALADRIRLLVLDGRLPPSTRLPSEREFARALGASRTTVAAAYAVLRDAGFLVSRRGAASRIQVPPGAGAPGANGTRHGGGGPGAGGGADGQGSGGTGGDGLALEVAAQIGAEILRGVVATGGV
ncbi:MAG: GntR family transcriptional regulator, partial [Actinopolymorphaceae bacterium]